MKNYYDTYITILKQELIPAMGCTEPIALALAGAKARELLGSLPEEVQIKVSGSIIKNAKSVIVPNTGQRKGIEVAVAAGIIAGDAEQNLQVLSGVTEEDQRQLAGYLAHTPIHVEPLDEGHIFDILVQVSAGTDSAIVRILDFHTHFAYLQHNDRVLLDERSPVSAETDTPDYSVLNMKDIWDFANHVDLTELQDLLQKQLDYNMAIAMDGLNHTYGANIGKVVLGMEKQDLRRRAAGMAAAASDARMNGCEKPVVINAGSGNQGITIAVPIAVYAEELGVTGEKLYRALLLANMIAIYEKSGIGRLSAFCGAVSAGAAAATGIAYLYGENYETIIHTLVNTLAVSSGILCDGAKSSCAAKIALSVEAGLMGYEMYKQGQQFYAGDGIVDRGVEATLENVGDIARLGMYTTNQEIIRIMTK